MSVFSEFRYPTTRVAKLLTSLLAIVLFAMLVVCSVSGFLLYEILRPPRTPATFDLSVMMGHPVTFDFSPPQGPQREGWLFPGLRGAPAIVVCHGYLSQRADVLTLVTALQEHGFNVFLFDFSGHGTTQGSTTLGYRETSELRAAIQALAGRDDVDPHRFGLWGVDMGGYAALEVASTDSRIGAIAVDDAYDDPREMLEIEAKRSGLTALPGVMRVTDFAFGMINSSFRHEPPVSRRLGRTQGIPKLFVLSEDRPALSNETLQLYTEAPDPKTLQKDMQSYRDMSDEDRKTYESQMVNFFLQSLPPSASAH